MNFLKKYLTGWVSPSYLKDNGILCMNKRNGDYISRYNSRSRYPLVDNKLLTKEVVEKAKIAAPKLIDVVRAQYEIEHIAPRLENLDQFVVKPANGSGGKGILVIVARDGEYFVKSSGVRITLSAVERHMTNILSGLHSLGGKPDVAFIETLVHVSDYFADYSYEGVPDIRIIVFKGYPVMGMLRLATHQSDGKANLHQGAVGVGLDLATGKATMAVQHNQRVTHHPDTGQPLEHIEIANWKQLLILAARCFEVTRLGYLGCDIVIDEARGPLILELNARPGLSVQIANGVGLLPRLRCIEALDDLPVSVEERVEFSMAHFATRKTVDTQESLWAEPAPA
ncbi:MAG: alpha-L-glutamate ligase-like protein [Pseudomonadales bacterium]|nr:alpha-L-glutamate ligase-like protein [Pseudomonadales bacterium]MCP5185667.1 alpha-L-glutamate ligase-like protein [Pseudomonadales bacterium]